MTKGGGEGKTKKSKKSGKSRRTKKWSPYAKVRFGFLGWR